MKAFIPLRLNQRLRSGLDIQEYNRFKNEIKSYSSNPSLIYFLTTHSHEKEYLKDISFEVSDNFNDEIKKINEEYSFKEFFTKDILIIHCSFGYDWTDTDDYYAYVTTEILQKLSLLIHLSYVCSITFSKGVVFAPSNKFVGKTESVLNNLEEALLSAETLGWPSCPSVDFDKTINWLKNGNMSSDKLSVNKAHIAVNALSYFFTEGIERDSAFLFWAVLGIEAIYAEGNVDIQKQIKQKTNIVLGQPKEYKKKLTQMYDYRSRLIHGDLLIPPKFADILEEFNPEYWNNLHFALSILISSIKIMIEQSIYQFEFEIKWKNKK